MQYRTKPGKIPIVRFSKPVCNTDDSTIAPLRVVVRMLKAEVMTKTLLYGDVA